MTKVDDKGERSGKTRGARIWVAVIVVTARELNGFFCAAEHGDEAGGGDHADKGDTYDEIVHGISPWKLI
jgi:hypothetical protein